MDQDIKKNIPEHLENDPLAPYNYEEVDELLIEEDEDLLEEDLELLEEEF